jgi:hypothetical protein
MIGRGNTLLPALAVLICVAGAVAAETGAASQPTTRTTMPAARKAQVPRGFEVVSAGGRSAFCRKGDEGWVRAALAETAAATRPTTMPSDIITMIQQRRQELTDQMMRDLSLTDRKAIDDLLDDKLLPMMRKIAAVNPTVYYFVATRGTVADLMEAGWTDPRFHYIRFARDFSYSPSALLDPDRPLDDLVWWVEIHDYDNAATRRDALAAAIGRFEFGLLNHNSSTGKNEVEHQFEQFIHDRVFAPLKLPHTEDWFDFAGSNLFAVKYAAMVTGLARQVWIDDLIGRPGQNRPFLQLDLIDAMDPADIRPQYVGAYDRMLVLKGSVVFDAWLGHAGDGALAKVLPAMRAHAPATPQELIDVVKKQTGFDLAPLMKADFSSPSTQAAH